MNPILLGFIIYFLVGVLFLIVFDTVTKRIRSKFSQATKETQTRLLASNNYIGHKTSVCLFICALWVFWPAVLIGAITDKKESDNGSQR